MKLIITLRKECENLDEARDLFQAVKTKLADQPDIKVGGCITADAEDHAPPDPPT